VDPVSTPVRRLAAGVLALLLVAPGAGAQDRAPACPAPAQPLSAQEVDAGLRSAADRGFLWRLHKDGITSHLYGTLHVARRDWALPGPRVRDALLGSRLLALELDPLDAAVQQDVATASAARAAAIPLPAPLQARLAARLRAECLPADALDGHGPELRLALLLLTLARRDGLEAGFGIEIGLAGIAREAGLRVASLETAAEQLRALQAPTADDALAWLAAGLDDIESGRSRTAMTHMASVWAEADLAELMRYEAWCDCQRTPADAAAMQRLLDARNPVLARRIAALHDWGEPVFAAVGSLHMAGERGVPALLARRGFVVEAVGLRPQNARMDIRALWDFDDPAGSEARFQAALAGAGGDDALSLQTQIARTYSLRGRDADAHALLDRIEPELAGAGAEPQVRHRLERGRTWRSARQSERARPLFEAAVGLAQAAGLEDLAIDAMHMMALIEPGADAQMAWNRRALAAALAARDPAARDWDASLANNIGMAQHGQGRYEDALASFRTALAARERIGDPARVRIAHWMIAWTLRSLQRHDEALAIQLRLEREAAAAGRPDGYVHEEIGENLLALGRAAEARPWFARAHAQHLLDTSPNRPDDAHLARLLERSR
jgi:uncharacterized protein YbaP (TraB family)